MGRSPIGDAEGRCVGGGTVINGGMAFRASDRVLDPGATATGDLSLRAGGLDVPYARVERFLSVRGVRGCCVRGRWSGVEGAGDEVGGHLPGGCCLAVGEDAAGGLEGVEAEAAALFGPPVVQAVQDGVDLAWTAPASGGSHTGCSSALTQRPLDGDAAA